MIPNDIPFCTVTTREASFSSRWESKQRPTARNYVRTLNWKFSSAPAPLSSGNPVEEELEDCRESEGMEDTRRTRTTE